MMPVKWLLMHSKEYSSKMGFSPKNRALSKITRKTNSSNKPAPSESATFCKNPPLNGTARKNGRKIKLITVPKHKL